MKPSAGVERYLEGKLDKDTPAYREVTNRAMAYAAQGAGSANAAAQALKEHHQSGHDAVNRHGSKARPSSEA